MASGEETFYIREVQRISRENFSNNHQCRQIMLAKKFIDKHYAKEIDLQQIAANACLSKFHFSRLFKSMYGRTPHQHLTTVRVEQAKRLLLESFSVTEVCASVGFESISSFTGLFKKMTGKTPAIFQRQFGGKTGKEQD